MTTTRRFTARSGPPGAVPGGHATPVAAVTAVLTEAFAALPEAVRADAPLYVLCGDWTGFAARRFVGRCHDTGRRLRPSDSTALEPAELVRPYTTAAGHRGACFLLAGAAGWAALGAATAGGAAVRCEISVLDDGVTPPACLVVATVSGAAVAPQAGVLQGAGVAG